MRDDNGRPPDARRQQHQSPRRTVALPAARVTGIQVAQNDQRQLLNGWKQVLSPRERVELLSVVHLMIEAEIRDAEICGRRWAA